MSKNYHLRKDRTGETRIMSKGLKSTIIAYRNNADIDIQFENGQIVCNRRYDNFKDGKIKRPTKIEYVEDYVKVTLPNSDDVILIDPEDVQFVKQQYWYISGYGYVESKNGQRLHRLIMNAPPEKCVDHINGNKLDNRKQSLRLCTSTENCRNRGMQINNTSGYKGVNWYPQTNKWRAHIKVNGVSKHIEYSETKEEAALAYNKAAIEYFGEFARLNVI